MVRTPSGDGAGEAPVGVMLVNLGSPEAPTPSAVRRYLREFLSDPLVVDWPRIVWLPILYGIILPIRGRRSAELYRRVWTPEGSPLVRITERQATALEERLGDGWRVVPAMRYGRPSLADGLDRLERAGCRTVVALPMFPQESRSTTGSIRAALDTLRAKRPQLRIVVADAFPEHPGYVAALVETIRAAAEDGARPDHFVFSFHGIPARQVAAGDPYRDHCEATAAALATGLGLAADDWSLVFQSRFGPERWLEPYADELVPALAERHRRVLAACPGFPADCLETIDEIGDILAEKFRAAGGEELRLAPCLNDHPRWIEALETLVRETLAAADAD